MQLLPQKGAVQGMSSHQAYQEMQAVFWVFWILPGLQVCTQGVEGRTEAGSSSGTYKGNWSVHGRPAACIRSRAIELNCCCDF